MDRIKCGQCIHGPDRSLGDRGKKCVMTEKIRTKGSFACHDHFKSSISSGLSCIRCDGYLRFDEVNSDDHLCAICQNQIVIEQKNQDKADLYGAVFVMLFAFAWAVIEVMQHFLKYF